MLKGPRYKPVTSKYADLLQRRACETTFHASYSDFSQPASSSQPAATRQLQPASQPSQPAKPASQRCIRASKPQASRHQASMSPIFSLGASNRMPQGATGRHRPPQPATGCQTFWHTQHQGGSQTCHKPIKSRRYGQLPSKSCGGGHGTTLGRSFQAFGVPTKIL